MTPVISVSVTAALVVATQVTRFGNAAAPQSPSWPGPAQPQGGTSSQVSVTCSL